MKKIYFILIPILFLAFIAVNTYKPVNRSRLVESQITAGIKSETPPGMVKNEQVLKNVHDNTTDRVKQTLNCKSCHATEYPTINDPGLLDCPRTEMISVYHSPAEGPETVVIEGMSDHYNGVVFSHRNHAKMSEMSGGCTSCHHYNTSGPVLSCKKCHNSSRSREEISLPDLKAAYHRQCMTCHKQWSSENGCNNQCHIRKTPEGIQDTDNQINRLTPKLNMPVKLVWETRSKVNKTVTFYHEEHIQIFKVSCKSCHTQQSCVKCHSESSRNDINNLSRIAASVEEHHKPCSNCHEGDKCTKCHTDIDRKSFDHGKTGGWVLRSYHSKLECTDCHGSSMPFKRLSNRCVNCHNNFAAAFDHKLIGFSFSESHKELECNNCHLKSDFTKTPACTECHDDKSYPGDKPGK